MSTDFTISLITRLSKANSLKPVSRPFPTTFTSSCHIKISIFDTLFRVTPIDEIGFL